MAAPAPPPGAVWLASVSIDGEMQFAPGPARPAVLLLIPLALAEELQAGAVDTLGRLSLPRLPHPEPT